MLGQTFFYSGYAPEKSISLIEQSGFSIVTWEIDDPSSRGHLVVIARKETRRSFPTRRDVFTQPF
ncbi:MAG: hypothetical protein ABIL68_11575 [bacterium]